jgi:hypothetical protein
MIIKRSIHELFSFFLSFLLYSLYLDTGENIYFYILTALYQSTGYIVKWLTGQANEHKSNSFRMYY